MYNLQYFYIVFLLQKKKTQQRIEEFSIFIYTHQPTFTYRVSNLSVTIFIGAFLLCCFLEVLKQILVSKVILSQQLQRGNSDSKSYYTESIDIFLDLLVRHSVLCELLSCTVPCTKTI